MLCFQVCRKILVSSTITQTLNRYGIKAADNMAFKWHNGEPILPSENFSRDELTMGGGAWMGGGGGRGGVAS